MTPKRIFASISQCQGVNQKITIGKASVASIRTLAHPNVARESEGLRGWSPLEKILRP